MQSVCVQVVILCCRYISILVCTGVFKPDTLLQNPVNHLLELPNLVAKSFEFQDSHIDHGHRDMPFCPELTKPDYVVKDVKDAIQKIFEMENFSPRN